MLKHFSNPSIDHPNNYWGNLRLIEKRKKHKMEYRHSAVMKKYEETPYWLHWEREELKDAAEQARIQNSQRREKRFDAHVRMLNTFFQEKVYVPGFLDSLFQVISSCPHSI